MRKHLITAVTVLALAGTALLTAQPAAAATPGRCHTSHLQISVAPAGASVGTAWYHLVLRSTATPACTLDGYPGVSFTSPSGQVGAAAARNPVWPSRTVYLAPGGTAVALLGVTAAGNYPASRCHPVRVGWLRVYPPGAFRADEIKFAATGCGRPVPVLSVTPVRAA